MNVISDRAALLGDVPLRAHLVQLYDADEQVLAVNVARYLSEGLARGEGAVVIATPEHRAAFAREIAAGGADAEAALAAGLLVMVDAAETLDALLVEGEPDPAQFAQIIGDLIGSVRERVGRAQVRAYGEMVGLLWESERYAAAIRLEELWNAELTSGGLALFCAYPIDVFGDAFRIADVDALLCAHTHLLPAGGDAMQRAVERAMHEVLGNRADGVRALMKANYRPSWAALPKVEAEILWLRNNLPDDAERILTRARTHYRDAA
ncbi:MAG TPA: MEDS domain-containing protein [Candidatus Elarobacter sp.]|jgi:hypothetical protein